MLQAAFHSLANMFKPLGKKRIAYLMVGFIGRAKILRSMFAKIAKFGHIAYYYLFCYMW